jgi:peptidoglycan/LPS O-acetylase OafA/YrhL
MDTHLPQLDGLRGIAILIVVLGHLVVFNFGFGIRALGPIPPLGIGLFFVLSGFLITRILLASREEAHYFRSFYVRRALRIWPLYFAVLTLLFAVTNHRVTELTFDENRLHWPVFALYFQNLFYRQATQMGPPMLAITWSLAVEEQFYTIWPAVVRKLSIRAIALVLSGTVVAAPLARFVAPRFGIDPYINPICRFDAMAMGGLLAIWVVNGNASKPIARRTVCWFLAFAVMAEVACHFTGLTHYLSKTIAGAAFTFVLALALTSTPLIRVLSNRRLRYLGKLSYCLYLVHPIVAAFAVTFWPGQSLVIRLLRVIAIAAGTLAVAALSWRFFEGPILQLKRYFPAANANSGKLPALPRPSPIFGAGL